MFDDFASNFCLDLFSDDVSALREDFLGCAAFDVSLSEKITFSESESAADFTCSGDTMSANCRDT